MVAISAGLYHSLALCSDGTMAAWGSNAEGQLGDNTTTDRLAPVVVNTTPLAPGERFTSVGKCRVEHTMALVAAPAAPTAPNHPPTVTCPAASTIECGSPALVTVLVGDLDGDALTVVWAVNGVAAQTNAVPANNPPAPATTNVSFQAELPLGTNSLTVVVADSASNRVSCSTSITVLDTTAPVITVAEAEPHRLWPPNHKMVPITVRAEASDICGSATWKIIGVRSNEPVNGHGDGNTPPDWRITGDHTLLLRAERSGKGDGRIYSITMQATDESGNKSQSQTVMVTVPKSQGNAK